MKIIHIIPSLQTGGAERLALDICIEISKRERHQVLLLTLNNKNHFESHDFIKFIDVDVKLSIKSNNKIKVAELQKLVDNFKPDIIHSHLFAAEIISRSIYYPKAKWFSHFHDNMPQLKNLHLKSFLDKKLITNFYEKQYLLKSYKKNGGNEFISISEDTNKYAAKVLPEKYKFHYLKNAINYSKFNLEKNQRTDTILNLINIGSFQAKKNQQFLIDVVKILKSKKIRFHLSLLGDGDFKKQVQLKVNQFGLEKEITLTGNVQNVTEYLANSDIYVHSAYYEPFGLVLLEAMAASLPVITLDGKGNRDLIEEGKNGYMIYEQDAEKFADRIIKLWEDKQKMQEISAYANKFAKQYDIVNYVDKLVQIYQNAINSK